MKPAVGSVLVPADHAALGIEPAAAILVARVTDGALICTVAAPEQPSRGPFADSVRMAERGDRTVRRVLSHDGVHVIGIWHAALGLIALHADAGALSTWIGRPVHRGELEASDSLASRRAAARRQARRDDMQGRPDRAAQTRRAAGLPSDVW